MDILKELEIIFQDVFDDESIKLKETTNANDIEDWDSLMQVRLIVAIEKNFSIKFNFSDLQDLKNVGEMVEVIKKKVEK